MDHFGAINSTKIKKRLFSMRTYAPQEENNRLILVVIKNYE
jgi:hypothetical protein